MILRGKPEDVNRQAGDWLARLHADEREPGIETAFKSWLKADPSHEITFERASMIWDAVGGLRDEPLQETPAPPRLSRRMVLATGAGLVVTGGVMFGLREAQAGIYETGVGEQRRLVMEDGTRMVLDTDTRIRFRIDRTARALVLDHGRVDVDISADPRPFQIDLGARHATARAGRIDLRREGDSTALTAISGMVRIGASGTGIPVAAGSRIAMAAGRPDRLDRPELNDLVAWQSGRLAFRDETLAEAVHEMNRYTKRALVIADARTAAMRVSGVYRVGNSEAFARSLAILLPIRVSEDGEAIRISAAN